MPDDRPTLSNLAKLALVSAAEAAEAEETYAHLPRLLRYALAEKYQRPLLPNRLAHEILEAAPDLAELTEAWLHAPAANTVALAAALENQAVLADMPVLVTLAHCSRLLGLRDGADFGEQHRTVAAALLATAEKVKFQLDTETRAKIDEIIVGWALVTAHIEESEDERASRAARFLARGLLEDIKDAAVEAERRAQVRAEEGGKSAADSRALDEKSLVPQPGYVRVCDLAEEDIKRKKLAELFDPYKNVIGVPVPLARTPALPELRAQLLFEFPYAQRVVDAIVEDLLGREYVQLRPTLLVGNPGGGKSHFAQRLADLLGAGCWRFEATTADGSMIGGTARRWSTSEPSHPFLAIARSGFANPLFVIEELEKAAVKKDYGRLWDSLLGLLEGETASRYPDPALQAPVNISHVSYLATANGVGPLPRPLRDRLRILDFPTPTSDDLHALLPPLAEAYVVARGQDGRWLEPFSVDEINAIAANWTGGSVRRLQRVVEAMLRAREKSAARH